MLIGNIKQQESLNNYFKYFETYSSSSNFVLLEGPKHIGKSSIVREIAKDYLGENFKTDYLELSDLSDYIGKKHSIKIEVDSKDTNVTIDGVGNFLDLGTRQIIEWLYKSSIANRKILYMQNIERMTISAANSFLKSFEEPLDNRIIIASTSNRHKILDTILSRAFIIKFEIPNIEETKSFLNDNYKDFPKSKLDSLMSISLGRVGFIKNIIDQKFLKDNYEEIIEKFDDFTNLIDYNGKVNKKMLILKSVQKSGLLDHFLDALVFYCYQKGLYGKISKLLKVKQLVNSNVHWENAVFYFLICND